MVIQQCLLYETRDRIIILACPYSGQYKIHMTGINECTGILIDSSVHRQNGYAGMSVLGINRESSFTGMPKRSMKSYAAWHVCDRNNIGSKPDLVSGINRKSA